MRRHYLLFCLTALLISSCTNKGTSVNDTDTIQWQNIDINDNKLDLSEIMKAERIVGLEETPESMVGRADKVIHSDSLLFVMDGTLTKKIYLFNANTGKYITSYGQVGGGPDEYNELNDISYVPETGVLYALTDYNKVRGFDKNGEIVASMTAPYKMWRMEAFDDRFCFFCDNDSTGEIVITDKDMDVLATHFPNSESSIKHLLIHPLQKNADGTVDYIRHLDNNIYNVRLDGDAPVSVKYTVDFGPTAYSRHEFEGADNEAMKMASKSHRGQIKYYADNDNYAVILFFDNNQPCISFYDKKSGESTAVQVMNLSQENVGIIASPIEYADGEYFMQVVDNPEFANLRENKDVNSGENPLIFFLK